VAYTGVKPAASRSVRRDFADSMLIKSSPGVRWTSFCWHGVQVRCIQATLGDLISGSASSGSAEDAAEPEDAVHTEVEVATVDSFQVGVRIQEHVLFRYLHLGR
jgi:hypothetical protein